MISARMKVIFEGRPHKVSYKRDLASGIEQLSRSREEGNLFHNQESIK